MPKVTIWIRNEDVSKWETIANRPEWLHEHLGIDIMKQKINGEEIFRVTKHTTYPEANLWIDGVPHGTINLEPTITEPEETA